MLLAAAKHFEGEGDLAMSMLLTEAIAENGRLREALKALKGDTVFRRGDVMQDPHDYSGWRCIESGSPGKWVPFGQKTRKK
jgi:hypothetical protein